MSAPAPIRRLDPLVAERPVRVLEAGLGPTIVLVHGLGLDADVWLYHLPRLGGAGYRVLAPDMPGFGESPGPAFGFTVDHAAQWLAALADACDVRSALWVGHSVAAQHVLRLAAIRPDLAAGVVLAAPTGETGLFRWAVQLGALVVTAFRERPRMVRRAVGRYLTNVPTRALGSWIASRRHLARDDAPLVRCPVRVVLGERDPLVPRAFAERLAATAPDGELVVIPDSAHGVALVPAEPFCQTVLEFAHRVFHTGQ
ncbi:MAG TPA: alpha/beta fold hydrolase [Longimicrobiales bacterium]